MENISDAGAATVNMAGTTTGGVSGNVTTTGGSVTLGGGNQIGGNLNMNSAGTAHMGTAGTVKGSGCTGTLHYARYAAPVAFTAAKSGTAPGVRPTPDRGHMVEGSPGPQHGTGDAVQSH